MIQPNPHLLAIARVAEHMDARARAVRLDRNERVSPFPDEVFRAMLGTLTPEILSTYPDPSPLYQRLSRRLDLPAEFLYLTNGSDAAIRMTFQTYLRPGERVVFPDPTYAMYAIYTQIFGGVAACVAYDAERRMDMEAIFATLERQPRLLALANPDQPTGAVFPEGKLRELITVARGQGTLVIVDEAYHPFYPLTAVPLVREFDNLIVTRTFSKVGGLAGLRVGYLVANPGIVENIRRVRGAHEVNAVAIAMACYVLDHPEVAEAMVAQVERGRQVLADLAHELGLGFPPCPTNFQLLAVPGATDTGPIVSALATRGFLVKGAFSTPAVRQCIRVTLAGPDAMREFAGALRGVLAERSLSSQP